MLARSRQHSGALYLFVATMLANVLAGASGVRYRDFVIGTLLGIARK